MKNRVVVIDFETTGLSTNGGDRAIEVGAVAIENGAITDSYQSLINPGVALNAFIENYTGISNAMLSSAPSGDSVFPDLYRFIDDSILIAHNAGFDRKFLDAEYSRVGYRRNQPFLCSMRLARRLYPKSPNHKLGTLVKHARIPITGDFHRAQADAEMTGLLWIEMMKLLTGFHCLANVDLKLLQKLECMVIARTPLWLDEQSQKP